ncbi:MAG: hypothetical protein PQJ58_15190 [Spirochaetales bacterium]|nr:hypothetical protein [Spirochaetales bacterium]
MQLSEIKKALKTWVKSQYGGKVIWMKSDNPVPPRPFIALDMKTPGPLHHPYETGADDQGIVQRKTTQQFSVTLQAYGEGANQSLFDLRESFDLLSVRKLLHDAGIYYLRDQMEVKDITAKTGTKHEERSVYEPLFIAQSVQTEEVGFIEEVTFKEEIHGRNG